jgi:DNA-binding SARP family transcriptional activator
VHVRVLGALELVGAEGTVDLTGEKRRALLALLAVRAGEVLTVDRIVEELWGEAAQGATGTVQTYVSQLRKVLRAGEGITIETAAGGYRLVAADDAIDGRAFEIAAGRALVAVEAKERLEFAETALDLWRGDPLAEFAGQAWADRISQAWQQRKLAVLEVRAQARLELGRERDAIADLERDVVEHPFHERFWMLYATALYRAGRPTDALRAIDEVRSRLADELGVAIGPELVDLERRILDHDPGLRHVAGDRPRIQARLAAPPPGGLHGRIEEREQLQEAWRRAVGGAPQVVLLGGEPGIGKTSLAGWMAREVDRDGGLAAGGRADEDLGLPYQVWAEVLEHLVEHTPAETLDAHIGRHGGALSMLVPSLDRRVGPLPARRSGDPETERFLTWASAIFLVRQLSDRTPVLIVLDDLQWADAPSLDLLHHAVRSGELGRVLIVATYRDAEATEPLTQLIATLGREGAVQRTLDVLSLTDTIELTRSLSGAPERSIGEAVHRETGGNPFFTQELLRYLTESGALDASATTLAVDPEVLAALHLPAGVQGVVHRRVTRLGGDAEALLTLAAVIGTTFDLATLVRAAERDDVSVLADLDRARDASLVVEHEPGQFAFAHALVAHTLVGDLGQAPRTTMHERVGRAIEAGPDADARVGELAHHWAEAGDAGREKAIEYARRAGDRALAALAPAEAGDWYARGLELDAAFAAGRGSLRVELTVALGRAEHQSGNPSHRETLLAAAVLAQESADGSSLVQAALANTRGFASNVLEPDRERRAVLEAALDVAEDLATRSRLLAALAIEHQFQNVVLGSELRDRAVQTARKSGDARALIAALISAPTTPPVNRAEDALATAEEAVALSESLDDPALLFLTMSRLAVARLRAGLDWRADADRRDQLAAQLGVPIMRWRSLWYRSAELEVTGHHEEAAATTGEALELGLAMGQPDTLVIYGSILSATCFNRDQPEQMRDLAQLGVANFPQMDSFRPSLTYASYCCGDTATAAELFAEDKANRFVFAPGPGWPAAAVTSATNAALFGDAEAAAILLPIIRPFADEVVTTMAFHLGAFAYYLGELDLLVGDLDAAERDLARAEEIHRCRGMPTYLCRTQLAGARLALRHGEPAAAAELVAEATLLAETHDLALSRLHAADLARAVAAH